MQLPASIRELFLNPTATASLPGFALSLCLAAVLGMFLGQAYVHFGQSLSNRRLFARNFVLLAVTTTLIISIVKSSLALSLGLVGALSIVRFRAAIKEPEELAFLFLAISIGLGLGAGQALVTIVALVIILGLIALRSLVRRKPDQPNFFLTVTSPSPAKLGPQQILGALAKAGAQAQLKRFDETPDRIEAAFVVDFQDASRLESFAAQVRNLNPQVQVSCLDDRGLAA